MRGYIVEMAFLMPIILLIIMSSIFGAFYFHDKNIVSGAAYETAAVGSSKMREKEGAGADELDILFQERVGGKCILFTGADASISISDDVVEVEAQGSGRGMKVSVLRRAAVTKPEKTIRDIRRIKELGNGAENNY